MFEAREKETLMEKRCNIYISVFCSGRKQKSTEENGQDLVRRLLRRMMTYY